MTKMIRRMLTIIKINLKYILSKFTIIASSVFGLASIVQLYFDWNTIGIEDDDVKCKIKAFTVLLFICFLTALVWGLHSSKEVTILSEDDVEIIVRYDDLMKIAFPKKPQTERIVVIAVNCCYDTVVNDDIIHEGSVHGQFLKRFAYSDEKRQALDAEIESSLKAFGYEYEDISLNEKREGKRKRYPMGSVSRIKGENGVTFFLLALTEFDVDCVAHCDKHQYFDCILKLFEYYDKHGQGKELYLYPMGTAMSRTGLSKKEALESIVLLTQISKNYLKCKTTIIVDKKCKNEISITDL